jgi:hypothetical protein
MAEGISLALPLRMNETDGAYALNKNIISMAEQNLKMVILTAPGERVMEPNFGVGVRNYLFEQNTAATAGIIKKNIEQQVKAYLPYIQISDLQVFSPPAQYTSSNALDNTRLDIIIKYFIPAIGIGSDLVIPIES